MISIAAFGVSDASDKIASFLGDGQTLVRDFASTKGSGRGAT